ncbi:MAG: hypothetical protein EOS41_29560 [Mesorhizobium sp.]|uniref:hypothetical protein n=1 Tax=Mesorhizobium sp. TaxID=1871066 RepID=UPI000FEA0A0F|nr:hypothetical protein [Mesorhizobium sp.]RWE19963.1 MAG: hypothetical protein EOS41_29560 [Mesorhizobium sp.]
MMLLKGIMPLVATPLHADGLIDREASGMVEHLGRPYRVIQEQGSGQTTTSISRLWVDNSEKKSPAR